MRIRLTVFAVAAFAAGALSDLVLIRNGLSYGGPTPLDNYPLLWPVWLASLVICSLLLAYKQRQGSPASSTAEASASEPAAGPAPAPEAVGPRAISIPLAMVLGFFVTHSILLVGDVATDPTSHNLWPIEYLFWGVVIAVPAFAGSLLAWVIAGLRP
jgi:hypothetical protein